MEYLGVGGLPVLIMRKLMPFLVLGAASSAVLLESSDFDQSGKTEILCFMGSPLFSKEVSYSWFT